MSTIATLSSTESGADSLNDINTNFTNLNADKVEGQSASVDSEVALFSGTGGKTIKRAALSGIAKLVSGVLSVVTAPTGVIVGDTDSQTLTNKTLTTPTIGSFANANHGHTNSAGGGTLGESALALTDVATNNASTSNHGFLKKLSNVATQFMDGTGNWSVPSVGSYFVNADETLTTYYTDTINLDNTTNTAATRTVYANGYKIVGSGTTLACYFPIFGYAADLNFSTNTKIVRIKFAAYVTPGATTNRIAVGLTASTTSAFFVDETANNDNAIRFIFAPSDTVYGATSKNSVGITATSLSTVTLGQVNLYEIIWESSTSVKFYVNGTLKATNTTNIPVVNSAVNFMIGSNNSTSTIWMSNPVISQQV